MLKNLGYAFRVARDFNTLPIMGAVVAAAFAAGIAAAELHEHRAPWGLGQRLGRLQDSLPERDRRTALSAQQLQLASDTAVINNSWRPALAQCQAARLAASRTQAQGLDAALKIATASRQAAYQLGRSSCYAPSSPATSPAAPAGVLRDDVDLAGTLAGAAYRPAAR